MRIERHPAVIEEDLPGIYADLARDAAAAAERVLDAVEATLQQLARQPLSGVIFRTRNPRLAGVRMLPVAGFENYLVFYRQSPKRCACSAWRAAPPATFPPRTASVMFQKSGAVL